jgi:hypothetical protein
VILGVAESYCVIIAHNNDERYIKSKREIKRESKDTDLTWFSNVHTFTKRRLYYSLNDSRLHHNI